MLRLPPAPGSIWGDTGDPAPSPAWPLGFVGSPCDAARDCDYPGAICLTGDDGYGCATTERPTPVRVTIPTLACPMQTRS